MAPVGFGVVGVMVLGTPVYFLWCVTSHRASLFTPSVFTQFGGLYKLFRLRFYWMGVADLFRRLILVVASVFLSNTPVLLMIVLFAVLLTSLVVTLSLQPYYYPLYNQLAVKLNTVLIVILMVGIGSYGERSGSTGSTGSTSGSTESNWTATLLFGLLVGGLVVFAVVSIHAFVSDVRQVYMSSAAKVGVAG